MKSSMSNKLGFMVVTAVASLVVGFVGCASEDPPTATPMPPIVVDIGMTASAVMAPLSIDFEAKGFTDGVSYFWDFGDGNSMNGTRARHIYLDAGTFTVRLSGTRGDETDHVESTITVQPGDAGWLILNAQELTLTGEETFQFEVEAYDHLGNLVSDPVLVWHADPAIGIIDQNGLFTAATNIGYAAEGVRVDFPRGNFTANALVPISVVHGAAATLSITPEFIDTRVTWTVNMHAEVLDHIGHALENAKIKWEVLRPGDEIDQTGHYTPSETISHEDASLILVTGTLGEITLEQIVKGIVKPGILDHIEVEGSLIDLNTGDEVQLTATGFDRFGNELELDELIWEVENADAGRFNREGMFVAGTVSGEFPESTVRVRGMKDGVRVFVDVPLKILPSKAASIEFRNKIDSVPAGSSSPIPLEVLDENGNTITDVDVYLEVTGGGRLGIGNSFKAGFEPGLYEGAVVARVLSGNAGNEGQLMSSTDIEVRNRSSDFLAIDIIGSRGPVVYMINLATGDLVPLSAEIETNEFIEEMPSWWPDGSRVAYSSNVNGKREIFDVDPFNGDVRLLASGDGDLIMPAISPDSTRIAFVESFENDSHVYVGEMKFNRNGKLDGIVTVEDARRLSIEEGARHLFPYWSPNSKAIMYTSTTRDERYWLRIADVDDEFGEVIAEVRAASGLAWHPDGEQVLLSTRLGMYSDNRESLALANLVTGEVHEIDIGMLRAGIAAMSPDGSEISFVDENGGNLWLMDTDGTGLRRALGGELQTTVTSWRPSPLELPTPIDRELGTTSMVVPNGDIMRDRFEDPKHGTIGPYQILIETDRGDIRIDLYNHLAPVTVENFLNLANAGYYDGVTFHTVERGSAVFSGSKVGGFGGTAGYYIPSEYHPDAKHDVAGTISMISKVVNSGSSEFVIALKPKADWNAFVEGEQKDCADPEKVCYAVFGRVIEGLEVLMNFEEIDKFTQSSEPHRILKITVLDATKG